MMKCSGKSLFYELNPLVRNVLSFFYDPIHINLRIKVLELIALLIKTRNKIGNVLKIQERK